MNEQHQQHHHHQQHHQQQKKEGGDEEQNVSETASKIHQPTQCKNDNNNCRFWKENRCNYAHPLDEATEDTDKSNKKITKKPEESDRGKKDTGKNGGKRMCKFGKKCREEGCDREHKCQFVNCKIVDRCRYNHEEKVEETLKDDYEEDKDQAKAKVNTDGHDGNMNNIKSKEPKKESKKQPCNQGKRCKKMNTCLFRHECKFGSKCDKKENCKFLHKEDKTGDDHNDETKNQQGGVSETINLHSLYKTVMVMMKEIRGMKKNQNQNQNQKERR